MLFPIWSIIGLVISEVQKFAEDGEKYVLLILGKNIYHEFENSNAQGVFEIDLFFLKRAENWIKRVVSEGN